MSGLALKDNPRISFSYFLSQDVFEIFVSESKCTIDYKHEYIFINRGSDVHCPVWNNLADVCEFDYVHFTSIFISADPRSGCGLDHCTSREPHRNLHCHSSS